MYVIKTVALLPSDGCASEPIADFPQLFWPETDLGQVASVECPCGDSSLGMGHPVGSRMCVGDFSVGARWSSPLTDACDFSNTEQSLCQVSTVMAYIYTNKMAVFAPSVLVIFCFSDH